jgi:hypothetical protein
MKIINRKVDLISFGYNFLFLVCGSILLSSFDYYLQSYINGIGWMIMLLILGGAVINHLQDGFKKIGGPPRTYFFANILLLFFVYFNFLLFPPINKSDILFPFLDVIYLYFLLLCANSKRNLLITLVFTALLLAFSGVFIDYLNPGTFSILEYRAAGFTGNPNGGAFTLVITCLGVIILTKSYQKITIIGMLSLSLACIGLFMTGSRGGVLCGLLILIALIPQLFKMNKKSFCMIFLMILSVVFLVNNLVVDEGLLTRLAFSSQQDEFANDASRFDVIPIYLNLIAENFWGIGRYENNSAEINAHNSILNFFAEFGWVGGLIYAFMIFLLIINTLKVKFLFTFSICLIILVLISTQNNVFYKREWLFLVLFVFIYCQDYRNKLFNNDSKAYP